MKYLKVWTSFRDLIQRLNDDEVGRLFLMMLDYAADGTEPDDFIGNESFLFPVAKQMIDMAAEKNEILRQNGLKGGRPQTKQNQTEPEETKANQLVSDGNQTKAYKEKERKEKKSNEKESSFLDDDEAAGISADHDRILNAAEDAGFKMSNDVRASLIALFADYGLQKVLDGLRSCSEHGAPNLAYLRACMKDNPKPGKLKSQQYEQRDYEDEQAEAMRRMIRAVNS